MKQFIKQLINRPGILGCLASFIYFTYGGGIKSGLWQAYNRQGFDLRYGVDTSELYVDDDKWSMGVLSDDAEWAVNSTSDKVERIVKGIDVLSRDHLVPNQSAFIDFGCGKGRALIVAAKSGFSSLVGIELSPYVLEICRNNLDKLSIDCQMYNESFSDVNYGTLGIEKEGNIVIYAYNPTRVNIIVDACANVVKTYSDKSVFLIYTNPQCIIGKNMIETVRCIYKEHKLHIYKLS